MAIQLRITGVLLICMGFVHIFFPKYFKWKQELSVLSQINREMMLVHTFFIAVTVLMMGLLCLVNTTELYTSPLGKNISLGLSIFWCIRLLIQFFGYSASLWKGKRFETTVHIIFIFLWAYLSAVFLWAWLV